MYSIFKNPKVKINKLPWDFSIFTILFFTLFFKSSKTYFITDISLFLFISAFTIVLLIKFNSQKSYICFPKKAIIPITIFILFQFQILIYWYKSPYSYFATRSLVFFYSSFIAFLGGYCINDLKKEKIINSFIIFVFLGSIYSILEYFGFLTTNQIHKFPIEITGHIGHKNVFGFCAMIALVWNLNQIFNSNSYKIGYLISFFIIGISLLLSDSRGSLVLALFGLITITVPTYFKIKEKNKFRLRLYFYLFFIISILIPIIIWNENTWLRIAKLFIYSPLSSHRSEIYKVQWQMFLYNPIFGNGLGSFIHENYFFWSDWMKNNMSISMITYNGHCEYLEVLSEFGIIGSLLYFSLWFGAFIIGVKNLIKKWSNIDYVLLISLLLLFFHASFSVASKRIPSSIILWLHIGYFWRFYFISFSKKTFIVKKKYFYLGFSLLFILVISLFFQILLSDCYYKKSLYHKSNIKKSINYLDKSISVYSHHPFALHQIARYSMALGKFDYTIKSCDQLISSSPNIFPINHLKGDAFFYLGMLDSSLYYANKELELHKKDLPSIELKARIYAQNSNCEKLNKMQNYYYKTYNHSKSIQNDSLDNINFIKNIGFLRSKFRKKKFKELWVKNKEFNSTYSRNQKHYIENILKLKCNNNLTTP